MRVGVLGAGAMGSIFGASLAGGNETILIDASPELVSEIEQRGVTLVRNDGEEKTVWVHATTDPSGEAPVDVLLVLVKAPRTIDAIGRGKPLIGSETVVMSLQNGWGNGETLARLVPTEQIVVGVTYHSGRSLSPGRIAHTASGPTLIGPFEGQRLGAAERAADAFRAGGLEVRVTPAIRDEIWKKLILNVSANPTAALTGLTSGELVSFEPVHQVVQALAGEAVEIAREAGYEMDLDERLKDIDHVLVNAGPSRASMLQDVERRRETEIEVLTGAILRAADAAAIEAPLHRMIYALVKGYEFSLGRT
jgi:2-dehydropantoate 2-reductase